MKKKSRKERHHGQETGAENTAECSSSSNDCPTGRTTFLNKGGGCRLSFLFGDGPSLWLDSVFAKYNRTSIMEKAKLVRRHVLHTRPTIGNHTIPPSINKTLHKFVIHEKESGGWEFRNMFILEVTTFNVVFFTMILFFWVINRQTHMRPTKGSRITRKQDSHGDESTSDDDDENDEGDLTNNSTNHGDEWLDNSLKTGNKRLSQQQRFELWNNQAVADLDVDDDGDEFFFSSSGTLLEGVPLTKEKKKLLEVLKHIKLFSYLDEEAIGLCLEHVEFVNLSPGDSVFDRGNFDGSLYAVMQGRVRCRFHEYALPDDEASDQEESKAYQRIFGTTFGKGEVVTSILAMLVGMVNTTTNNRRDDKRDTNDKMFCTMPIAREMSAVALDENTQLVRISPTCFAQVMERYPANVYRIAQTALNRAQRLTVLTLVQTLGLRQELVVLFQGERQQHENNLKNSDRADHGQPPWGGLFGIINSINNDDPAVQLKNRSCMQFAECLGINVETDGTESIKILQEYCEMVSLSPKQTLFQTGESHDACYLLVKGTIEMGLQIPVASKSRKSEPTWLFQSFRTISPGNLIGEHTCFTGDVSVYQVRCSTNLKDGCTLLKVPRHVYGHLIRRHPSAMSKSLRGILQQVSSDVHVLNWTSEWMHVEAAGQIVARGDPCDSMFVVLNGRLRSAVSSRQKRNDPRLQDREFGRGKIVGEVGCLTRANWEENLYAIRNSEIVRVPLRTLLVIIEKFPGAGLHFARSIAGKVAEHFKSSPNTSLPKGKGGTSLESSTMPPPKMMRSYGLRLATIAVVPLSDLVNIEQFSSCLVKSFAEIAPCKLLTKQFVRGELGEKIYRNRNEIRRLRITRLLADMEESHRLVVYQADQKYTWWTHLCIQQADCILLVVNAERAPGRRRVEQRLEWFHNTINVRIDLVVVGSQNTDDDEIDYIDEAEDEEMTVSDQLNNWSEKRKWISGHHLVRKTFRRYPMDFRRLCRRVSGRAVGLVLGGGGARGLAHVGVIKALIEAGVTVDLVGGTSQGAFVGALFARHPDDYKQCEEACRKMAGDMSSMRNKLFDLTLPMTSIFCGRLFNLGIRKRLGKIRIQDLIVNFFCVSVDLKRQKQLIHTKGILWKYCRASMSLTSYLPPVAENGTLLVDGGYMNSVPVDVMREEMNPRIVIAVDVTPEIEREYYDYGMSLSGWWLLFNSLNPFSKTVQVPSMGDISDMLVWVSSERHRRNMSNASDLYLTPPVTGYGTLDYGRFDELVQMGYEYSKPLVEELVHKHPWIVMDSRVKKTERKKTT